MKQVKFEIRRAKKEYTSSLFEKAVGLRSFYSVVRKLTGEAAPNLPPLKLLDGTYVTELPDRLKQLADQFAKNFNPVGPGPAEFMGVRIACEWLCT
ncbi:MAG: hypothetical protein GY696_24480 [Gammaproteobacteria bacterium]|nr:hypothetical protein [Gammaproteobacteria bacterium]